MLLYQLILIGTLISELFAISILTDTFDSLEEAHTALSEGENPQYGHFESVLSERFNEFFFSAVNSCSGIINIIILEFLSNFYDSFDL